MRHYRCAWARTHRQSHRGHRSRHGSVQCVAFRGKQPPRPLQAPFRSGLSNAPASSWKVDVRAPWARQPESVGAHLAIGAICWWYGNGGAGYTGTGGAQLLDGRFGVSLEFPDAASVAHHGSIVIKNASFARLAAIVDPLQQPKGRLTGSFSYHIPSLAGGRADGPGEATLEEGNIFALPLWPCCPPAGCLDPRGGYHLQRRPHCHQHAGGG